MLFNESFATLRDCGDGRRECEVLWVGPWTAPHTVTRVVHPLHESHGGGFQLNDAWITKFWLELARNGEGVRAQVHTHPGAAFHSHTDDAYPIIHTEGFLSLVIPRFAKGGPTLEDTFLVEIDNRGAWREVDPEARLHVA